MNKIWALFGVAILLTAGIATPASAQSAAGRAAPAVLASGENSSDPDLRCDILEVKRVSGGALLIRWRLVNAAGQAAGGGLTNQSTPKSIHYYFANYDSIYYIDPAENKKYQNLKDSANSDILSVFYNDDFAAGQQRLNWAKFPAPPATSTKISITIPGFAPFEDVPVAQ